MRRYIQPILFVLIFCTVLALVIAVDSWNLRKAPSDPSCLLILPIHPTSDPASAPEANKPLGIPFQAAFLLLLPLAALISRINY